MRKSLGANSGVNSLVAQRIYPSHLSTRVLSGNLKETDFPCISIHQQGSDKFNSDNEDGAYYFQINSWSNTELQICNEVYEAIFTATQHQTFEDSDVIIEIYEDRELGMLSEKTKAGVRHWHTMRWKVFATFKN